MPTRHPRAVRRRAARLAAAVLLAAAPRAVHAQARVADPDTLVVATYAYAAVDRAGAVAPLAAHLEARLRRPTRVVALADPVALAAAVREGQADVAVTNTFGYLLLAAGAEPAAVPVATFHVPAGVATDYGTVLVTRHDALRTMDDVRARATTLRLALVAPGSTTGNLVPRLWLGAQGLADLEGRLRTVRYGGTHAATFALLHADSVDVAALATEEFLRQSAAVPARDGAAYRVLWRSPDIQLGPVAVRRTLAPALQRAIGDAVVGLEHTAPAAFAALRGGWTEARRANALAAANDATYADVRRLFGSADAAAALVARFASAEGAPAPQPRTPQAAVDALLAADRAFSASGSSLDAAASLAAAFAPDVAVAIQGRGFAMGDSAAAAAIRASRTFAGARATWTPVRGGISADGTHGFTVGFMTAQRDTGGPVPLKYLAYWTRRPDGWRMAAFKWTRRPAGDVSLALMPPALPARLVPPTSDAAQVERWRMQVDSVERAFSDSAQQVGLEAAFTAFGSADAINLGGPADTALVVGAAAIGQLVGAGAPGPGSPLSWAPDQVLVASSGDLAVTIGYIRLNAPPPDMPAPPPIPFFTIWRRESPTAPWRYVAE